MIPTRSPIGRWQIVWPCFTVILALALFAPLYAQGGAPPDQASAPPSDGLPVTVTGELTVLYIDDFDNQRGQFRYVLQDILSSKRFNLRFQGEPPPGLHSGLTVRARGRARDDELVLAAEGDGEQSLETLAPAAAEVAGEQRTLVLVTDLQDTAVSCPLSEIEDLMFTNPDGDSVATFYETISDGQVWFSGEVSGPFAIDYLSTDSCDPTAWADAADAAAAADGIDVSAYQRTVYVMPRDTSCSYTGLGVVGATTSRAWVFRCFHVGLYAHEIGHNLGMHHASTPSVEYGDTSDVMGSSADALRGLNGAHQDQLGWLAPEQVPPVTESGVYDIAPLELYDWQPMAPQVLKIAKPDSDEYYFLSFRQPNGYDANLSASYLGGLNIHLYKGDGSTTRTYFLAALTDNEDFVDSSNGVTVTQLSQDADAVTVQVQFDTPRCVAAAPSMSLSPSIQSATPGSTLDYTVTVTNQDDLDCAPTTFALSGSLPDGWTGTLVPGTLTLAAGAAGSARLSVSSPAAAAASSYDITVRASASSDSPHTAAADGRFEVFAGDTEAPTAPTGLLANLKRKQALLSWIAAEDNVGVSGYTVWRNGVQIGTSTGTDYADSTLSAGATYSYSVRAYDAAGNLSGACNPASVTVADRGNGKGGKPK